MDVPGISNEFYSKSFSYRGDFIYGVHRNRFNLDFSVWRHLNFNPKSFWISFGSGSHLIISTFLNFGSISAIHPLTFPNSGFVFSPQTFVFHRERGGLWRPKTPQANIISDKIFTRYSFITGRLEGSQLHFKHSAFGSSLGAEDVAAPPVFENCCLGLPLTYLFWPRCSGLGFRPPPLGWSVRGIAF